MCEAPLYPAHTG